PAKSLLSSSPYNNSSAKEANEYWRWHITMCLSSQKSTQNCLQISQNKASIEMIPLVETRQSPGMFQGSDCLNDSPQQAFLTSKCGNDASQKCRKGVDELKFHFRQLVPVIFTLLDGEKHVAAASVNVVDSSTEKLNTASARGL
ncbi:unnamed protein product, partial [Rangifer tarandus platyrhynchus]